MRKGKEILKQQLGKKLIAGTIQSYFFDNEMVDKINVLYLKFDKWIHITTTDETAVFENEENKLKQIEGWVDDDGVSFEYPLTTIEESYEIFNDYLGRKLIAFSELVSKDYGEITCGLKLSFENDLTLVTYSDADEESFLNFDGQIPEDLKEGNVVQQESNPHTN